MQWDPPTETGGRDDLTYTVTVSPLAQLSVTVLTSTSVTVTAQYNVEYTVSVVATNCAGNSTTADYNFRIGELRGINARTYSPTTDSPSGGCPALTNQMNGTFGPVSSRLPGSTVTIQFDAGCVSAVTMVACEGTLMWSPDPEAIECTSLTTPTPTTSELSSCCMDNVYSVLILHYTQSPLQSTAQLHYHHHGMAPSVNIQYQLFLVREWSSSVTMVCSLRG